MANKHQINKQLGWQIAVPDPTPSHPKDKNGQVIYPDGKPYYFYVLYCADHSLYGGFTDNVKRRFAVHQAGKGAKYTRPAFRHPLKLIYYQAFRTKHEALSAEYRFKHQSRQRKEKFLARRGIDLSQY